MGGKRRLTDAQEDALRRLRIIHEDKIEKKRVMRREIEERYRLELRKLDEEESRQMNVCRNLRDKNGRGIPKTEIKLAVGVGNWQLLEDMYALTAHEFTPTNFEPGLVYEFDFLSDLMVPKYVNTHGVVLHAPEGYTWALKQMQYTTAQSKAGEWYVDYQFVDAANPTEFETAVNDFLIANQDWQLATDALLNTHKNGDAF